MRGHTSRTGSVSLASRSPGRADSALASAGGVCRYPAARPLQAVGPHTSVPEAPGATIIEDEVQYALPYWPVGELAHPLVRLSRSGFFGIGSRPSVDYVVEDTRHH